MFPKCCTHVQDEKKLLTEKCQNIVVFVCQKSVIKMSVPFHVLNKELMMLRMGLAIGIMKTCGN